MTKTRSRPCPVCDSGESDLKHTQDVAAPDELHFNRSFDVVTCKNCGCTFADIPNAQSELDDSYKDHSKYADTSLYAQEVSCAQGVSDAPWDVARLEGVADYLAAIVPDRNARILDAGCATGTFLGFLKERGFTRLWGLEPSPLATATARRLHGVEAVTGSFITPPADIGTFDVIALSHVLEHLTDVRAAVESLYALLNPGGIAYIEVPDATHYADHLVAPFHDFNTEHINHFSLPVLQQLFASAGFEPSDGAEKVVMCAAKYTYPAIYATWRKPLAPLAAVAPAGRDDRLVAGIDNYVEASARLMQQIDHHLETELAHDEDVIVWGAGQLSMKLLCDTVLKRKHIVAIVDGSSQKHGMHMNGHTIVAPSAVSTLSAPIVVTSIHHEPAIVDAIYAALGPTRRIVSLSMATVA